MRGQVAALYSRRAQHRWARASARSRSASSPTTCCGTHAIGTAIVATCVTASVIGLLLFRSGFATYAATRADAAAWPRAPRAGTPDGPAPADRLAAAPELNHGGAADPRPSGPAPAA